MQYSHKIQQNILYIQLDGDLLGAQDSLELMDNVNDAINQGVLACIIDISKVRYMNSSGLGVLITIFTKFKNKSGEAVILQPTEQIAKLMAMTKLDTVMKIVQSEEEAAQKLKGA